MFTHTGAAVRITRLFMKDTGTFNAQYRRNYISSADGQSLAVLSDRLQGADSYQPSMMAGVANQFIQPNAAWEKQLTIVNGWDTPRIRFQMTAEIEFRTGAKLEVVVLGYTDNIGVTLQQTLDPNMKFYVNSILHLRRTVEFTPMGNQTITGIADNSHILVNPEWEGMLTGPQEQRMRPEDVFAAMGRSHLQLPEGSVVDERCSLTNVAIKSRRSNNQAPAYMANILENHRIGTEAAELGQSQQQILAAARGFAVESSAAQDPFLAAINNIRGTPLGNMFTWSDLVRLDPNVQDSRVTTLMLSSPVEKAQQHYTGMTANWDAANRYTQVAAILANSVPSLMMELMLTKAAIVANNKGLGGRVMIGVPDFEGFTNIDLSPFVQRFMARMEHEILRDITFQNQITFELQMTVDLLGETRMKFNMDGQPTMEYTCPSFADALFVPVLTNNFQLAQDTADNFDALASVLTGDCNGAIGAQWGNI